MSVDTGRTQVVPSAPARSRWTRRILWANLVAQVGIVVTGGLVRLTGSGLGCPTWPECTAGSLVPVPEQDEGVAKLIEFGNRTLTFLLVLIAFAALVAVSRGALARSPLLRRLPGVGSPAPVRRPLVVLAGLVVVGIVGQAVLGGITVLLDLHPATVAAHFLVSMAMIAAAFLLLVRAGEAGDQPVRPVVRSELRMLARVLTGVGFTVLVIGTVVTGSGPHSGDADVVVRFAVDPQLASWLHADVVILFVGLTVAFWLGAVLSGAPDLVRRRAVLLLGISLAQGFLGYLQHFTGLPILLVALHMLGACLVWIATLGVLVATRSRGRPELPAHA